MGRILPRLITDLTVSLYCPLVLSIFYAFCSASPCDRRFIILRIQHQDCVPKSVMTSACRGTCTSYVRPSIETPDALERFCQCCDADDVRHHRVIVRCPNPHWSPAEGSATRFRRILLGIHLPSTCRCRPCSPVPQEIVPAENDIMNEGKRGDPGWNVTYGGHELDNENTGIDLLENFSELTLMPVNDVKP